MTENDEFGNEWSSEEKVKAFEFLASPLFKKLTKAERAKIIYVLKTPGEQELDMLMRIWGHTPSQVVHIITSALERETARTLNWFHLTSPKSLLENLMKYIKEELRQYDLAAMERDEACRLILETFHGPFDTSADPLYREAMAAYIHDRVYFETLVDVPQLALAEAWLGALKRDRRRKGE